MITNRFSYTAFVFGFLIAFFFPTLAQRIIDHALAQEALHEQIRHQFADTIHTLAYGGTPWEWIDNIKALGHEVDKQWIAEYEQKRHRRNSDA